MDRSDILLNTNPYLQLNLGLSPIQMRPEFTDLFHTNYDSSHDSPKCIQGFQKKNDGNVHTRSPHMLH